MARSSAALALSVLLASRAAADALPAEAGELRPAFLQLWINQVPGATALALLGGDGDIWVSPDHLSRSGLVGVEGARREVEGRTFVSLRSLTPGLGFALDEVALAIRITAGPELLRRGALDFRPLARPPDLEAPWATSAFLNWSGRASTDEQHSAYAEAGVATGPALLDGSVSVAAGAGVVRGLTARTLDEPDRLVRLVAGDALVRRDPLGGAPLFGGLTLARELSLDPYLVRAPLPHATAFATTPSTLEVWLNGAVVATQQVSPGTYDLTHLPVRAGANDLEVVVRDAFGRTEVLDVSHYHAQGLLARGLHDWAWHLGLFREGFGTESFAYGDPLLAGRHRYGLAERLTGGLAAEATPDVAQGSASFAAALPVGALEGAAAGSVSGGRGGAAGLVAWSWTGRRMSFGADWTIRSSEYAHAGLDADDPRARWRAAANVRFPVGRETAVHLRWQAERASEGRSSRADARTTLRLAPFAWLVLSAGYTEDPARGVQPTAFAQLVVAAPGGATVDASARRVAGSSVAAGGVQKPLPPGPGVGYRVRGDGAGDGSVSALVQAQRSFGRLELAWDRDGSAEVGSALAAGGVVLAGGRLFATRPVQQGFAILRVPGVAGVRGYVDHHEIGRTDASGDLLVPELLPYYASRLSIADADVPAAYRVGRVSRTVAVRPRAAPVVSFDVERLRAIEGWVQISTLGGAVVPAWGTFEADLAGGGTLRSPIGDDGGFWLENVPAGKHAARVHWEGKVCELALEVPESGAGVVELGTLTCPLRIEGW